MCAAAFSKGLHTPEKEEGCRMSWECLDCGRYLTEDEEKQGNCPDCGAPVEDLYDHTDLEELVE
jgi:rubrerythrin